MRASEMPVRKQRQGVALLIEFALLLANSETRDVFAGRSTIETGSGSASDRPLAGESVRWWMAICGGFSFPRIAGREIDLPQDPRQGKSRSVGDERTAVLALSDGAEDTRSLRRSSNGAAGRPVLLLVVRTSGTPVRAVRGDLDPLPRCVVGLAVPRKTRGGRLVRTLRGVQSVLRRSRQAIRRLGANVSPRGC